MWEVIFRKTNPPLIEWLFSPIVYRENGWLADRMRQLAPEIYNFTSARYHYYHMASRNFREYLRGDTVIRKKYLYVLRPLLAVNWIENGPIQQFFQQSISKDIFNSRFDRQTEKLLVGNAMLTRKSNAVLQKKLDKLILEFNQLNNEDAGLSVSGKK